MSEKGCFVRNKVEVEGEECMEFCDNGIDALNIIDKHKYDAILMDIQMPGLDGFETSNTLIPSSLAAYKQLFMMLIPSGNIKYFPD